MTQIDSDAALLAVTLVGRDGKRRYDSQSKRRLVEACLQPGVSVAGLALKAGVNANLLRRWIKLHQERNGVAATSEVVEYAPALAVPSAFVPVVEISGREVVEHKDAVKLASEPTRSSPPPVRSRLTVEMPNGVRGQATMNVNSYHKLSSYIDRRCYSNFTQSLIFFLR